MILQISGLVTGYRPAAPIVQEVDIGVDAGTTVAIVGPNGAGKSTVLKAVGGVLPVWQGHIVLGDTDISRMPTHARIRAGIGYVPQGDVVFPWMSVLENLQMGAFLFRRDRGRIDKSLRYVYDLFPRLADRRSQRAGTLSGGEQQMLAIGRALMTRPQLLIMDEPSLGLSPQFVQTVFTSLARLKSDGLSMLLVEQKVTVALEHADSGYVLVEGRNYFQGTSAEILSNPEIKELYLGVTGGNSGKGATVRSPADRAPDRTGG